MCAGSVETTERLRLAGTPSYRDNRAAASVVVMNASKCAMAMISSLASATSDYQKQGEVDHGSPEDLHVFPASVRSPRD